jgi:hypothetical protein
MEKDLEDGRKPDAFRDQELDEAEQFLRQHHKAKGQEADAEGGKQFCEDVPIQELRQANLCGSTPSKAAI